jgi:hypothetical protein
MLAHWNNSLQVDMSLHFDTLSYFLSSFSFTKKQQDVCIIYFYFLWLYNEFFIILYNILKIAELDYCQITILSIYVPSTHAYIHVLRLSLDLVIWQQSNSAIFYILYRIMKNSLYSHRK